jgi:hypothetical protein
MGISFAGQQERVVDLLDPQRTFGIQLCQTQGGVGLKDNGAGAAFQRDFGMMVNPISM